MFLVYRVDCLPSCHFAAQQDHPVDTSPILLGWVPFRRTQEGETEVSYDGSEVVLAVSFCWP